MTPADLLAAAKVPGSTVNIPPGSYGSPFIKGAKGVTFIADPAARFDTLTLYGCTDTSWSGGHIELPAAMAPTLLGKIVRVAGGCQNVSFSNATILGALATLGDPEDSPTQGNRLINGRPAGFGLSVEMNSTGITVQGCDISRCFKGVTLSTVSNSKIIQNHIHDNRASGIVGDCHDTLISQNHIHNFRPWRLGLGDHCEGIHLYTVKGDLAPKANISVTQNWIDQDQGDPTDIGIGWGDNSGHGFDNGLIDRNTILNGYGQAIFAFNFRGAITGNTCLETSGDPYHDAPSIRVAGSTDKVLLPPGILVNGNTAHDIFKLLAAAQYTQALGLKPMSNTIVPSAIQTPAVLAKARAAAKTMLGSA